jgi:hypothetical protein
MLSILRTNQFKHTCNNYRYTTQLKTSSSSKENIKISVVRCKNGRISSPVLNIPASPDLKLFCRKTKTKERQRISSSLRGTGVNGAKS